MTDDEKLYERYKKDKNSNFTEKELKIIERQIIIEEQVRLQILLQDEMIENEVWYDDEIKVGDTLYHMQSGEYVTVLGIRPYRIKFKLKDKIREEKHTGFQYRSFEDLVGDYRNGLLEL